MSESPPDDELRALIAMEKAAAVDPGLARDRLAERLAPLLLAPAAAAPSSLPRLPGWKLASAGIATFVLGGVTGAAIHASTVTPRTEIRYVDRVVEVDRTKDAGAEEPSLAPSSLPSAPMPSERTSHVERPVPTTAPSSSDEVLARERQAIEKARSALARGDAESALSAVAEHAKAFPRGQLTEAREAIAIQALARAGRRDEARARAERFRQKFPGSMYSPVVEAAISSIP